MLPRALIPVLFAGSLALLVCVVMSACGGSSGIPEVESQGPLPDPVAGPAAGNPDGRYPVPVEARAEDVSIPDHVIGTGTPESCTPEAFSAAVAQGGIIVFDGGPDPFTLTLNAPAKVFNDADPDVVIDGGGLVTLSGGGTTRTRTGRRCVSSGEWRIRSGQATRSWSWGRHRARF